MQVKKIDVRLFAAALAWAGLCGTVKAAPDEFAFFETKIRPVLVAKCYRCHSAEAQKAGRLKANLLLDSRDGMLKGGESGPAIVPGQKGKSLLLDAIGHKGIMMPPEGKMSAEVLADFAAWVEMGAPDPRKGPTVAAGGHKIDVAAGRNHWSYRRLAPVSPPRTKDAAWARNDIDRFIRARHEAAGVVPNAEAAKEILLRRVTFDLVGRPPTPDERHAYLADESAGAYEKVVDRLLDSQQFGERWARHWLDVVRYGESGGYENDSDRGAAYHYRDFVIRAFNSDMPYDEFLRLQVAGDLLRPDDYQAVSATGMLVAGPYPNQVTQKTIEPIRYDQLDDMATALGAAALGMTIGCARCHDHKYDPIEQRDYYALISCLRNAVQAERPVDRDAQATARALKAWSAERAPFADAAEKVRRELFPATLAALRSAPPSSARWVVLHPQQVAAKKAKLAAAADGVVTAAGKAEVVDDSYRLVFRTYRAGLTSLRLEALAGAGEPRTGPGAGKDGDFRLSRIVVSAKPLVPGKDRQPFTAKLRAVAATAEAKGFEASLAVDDQPDTGWSLGGQFGRDHAAVFEFDRPIGFEGGTELAVELFFDKGHGLARLRVAVADGSGPAPLGGESTFQATGETLALAAAVDKAGKRIESDDAAWRDVLPWYRQIAPEADRAFAALDAVDARRPKPATVAVYRTTNGPWVVSPNNQGVRPGSSDVYFLSRGEVDRKREKMAPGFIRATIVADDAEQVLLAGADGAASRDSRIGLADYLTDTRQGAGPLVARVIVNRLWHHHFGRGIVATPNDLGTQGDRPSHPELLEWLAGKLVNEGWSLKKIHRLIVTSATYRQGGEVTSANRSADPENLLLWHRRPVRLEGEAIRDALLAVSGSLSDTMFGPSVAKVDDPRRSIYLRLKRSEPIGFLRLFDQPEPVQPVGARGSATVATQSLAMMNSPFVWRAAEGLAKRARLQAGGGEPERLLDAVTTIALGRSATARDREILLPILAARGGAAEGDNARQAALVEICQIVLCMNEFVYID